MREHEVVCCSGKLLIQFFGINTVVHLVEKQENNLKFKLIKQI
jgi:hypothetical protein